MKQESSAIANHRLPQTIRDECREDREKVCAALIAVKDKIDIFINPNFGKA